MNEIPNEFPLPEEVFERQRALVSAQISSRENPIRPRRRGAIRAAVASAAVLGVLLVTPAFGIGGQLLDVIQGKPAPTEVKASFASSDKSRQKLFALAHQAGERLHDRYSPVLADQTRGVFAIETADGPIYLWAAPTQDGRECWLIQTNARPGGVGSCDGINDQMQMRPGIMGAPLDRPSVKILHARVLDGSITRVVFELEGSPAISLPVVDGYVLGTVSKDAQIVGIVGRNADDNEVARVTVH